MSITELFMFVLSLLGIVTTVTLVTFTIIGIMYAYDEYVEPYLAKRSLREHADEAMKIAND